MRTATVILAAAGILLMGTGICRAAVRAVPDWVAAANNAREAAAKELDVEITKATGGIKIPGLG